MRTVVLAAVLLRRPQANRRAGNPGLRPRYACLLAAARRERYHARHRLAPRAGRRRREFGYRTLPRLTCENARSARMPPYAHSRQRPPSPRARYCRPRRPLTVHYAESALPGPTAGVTHAPGLCYSGRRHSGAGGRRARLFRTALPASQVQLAASLGAATVCQTRQSAGRAPEGRADAAVQAAPPSTSMSRPAMAGSRHSARVTALAVISQQLPRPIARSRASARVGPSRGTGARRAQVVRSRGSPSFSQRLATEQRQRDLAAGGVRLTPTRTRNRALPTR